MRYFLTIAILFSFNSSAQERKFTYYTTADGLPSNWIYACKEDSRGFLWIATESGLVRFDGNNFITYDTKDGMPDVEVLDLAIDKEDKVWLNVFRFDPCYYDPVLNRVINAKENIHLAGYLGAITSVTTLQDGSVGYTSDGIKIFGQKTPKPIYFKTGYFTYAIWRHDNDFVAVHPHGFLKLSNDRIIDSIILFPLKSGFGPLIKNQSDSSWFYNNLNDSIYLFTDINFSSHSVKQKSVKIPEKLRQIRVGNNYLWAITTSGNIYMLNKQTLEIINKLPLQVKANSVYEDRKGNFWVCSLDKGLIKLSAPLIQSFAVPNDFTERNFISICRIQNKIFAGNYNGDIIETDGRSFVAHKTIAGSGSWVRQLLPFKHGLISISENGSYINFSKPLTNQYGINSATKNGFLVNDSTLLVSGWNGIYEYSLLTKKMTDLLIGKRSTGITLVKKQIYFGSIDGLYKWIQKDSALNLATKNEIFSAHISWVYSTKDNLLWVGTVSDGLMVVYKDSLIATIRNENHLASNVVRFIQSGKLGTIWVATNKGISAINYSFNGNSFQYNISNIGPVDGLLSPQVNALWVENDTVYAATANGINYFPAGIKPSENKLQVYITGFSVNGSDTSLISGQSFHHRFKNIILHFAAPEINGSTISYQYNINNAGWQNNNNGLLELPQLKPGRYSIDFRAIDANGKASPLVSNFKFAIHPAWWQTWWFIALAVAIVGGLLFYWLQKNNRNKRERALEQLAAQQKLTDLELQAVKAQINPHFVFNCLNSIKSLIHQQKYEDADTYLDNFSYLLRSTIDHSSQKMIPLADEIKYIDNYLRLEQLRFGKKLSYKIDATVTHSKKIQIPSMLLQPYVENAIKHGIRNLAGGNGFVSINFIQAANTLTCNIEDNGVGREAATYINAANPNYHQSVGLSLTGKREELFGILCHTVDKKDDTGKSMGTTVVLEIPLHYI